MKESASEIRKIAFVGDYLPRKCGIATFTPDMLAAVAAEYPRSECFVVPVNDIEGGYDYPEVVRFEIEEQDLDVLPAGGRLPELRQRRRRLPAARVRHLRRAGRQPPPGLLRDLRMPVVTTLHTVLREPNADQRRVMQELIALLDRVVVMTERGRPMLQEIYQASAGQDRPHPARHPRHAVRRPELLQGPVRRRGQDGAARPSGCSRRTRASSTCSTRCRRSSRSSPTSSTSSSGPPIPNECASRAKPIA